MHDKDFAVWQISDLQDSNLATGNYLTFLIWWGFKFQRPTMQPTTANQSLYIHTSQASYSYIKEKLKDLHLAIGITDRLPESLVRSYKQLTYISAKTSSLYKTHLQRRAQEFPMILCAISNFNRTMSLV